MKIESLEYIDHASGWKLEKVDFQRLTLLVGASGVGKTKILEAILNLKGIARGKSFNGIEWNVRFSTADGRICEWRGRFEKGHRQDYFSLTFLSDESNKDLFNIEFERLTIDGSLVIERKPEKILLNGEKTVKLSPSKSVLELLKEEEEIKAIHDEFSKILFDDGVPDKGFSALFNPERFHLDLERDLGAIFNPERKFTTLDDIRRSNEDITSKLYLTYANELQIFNEIKDILIGIFPYIQDIKVQLREFKPLPSQKFSIVNIQMKEAGVADWIDEARISSGMLKTLQHIAELYLCPNHSLILIDEFENSLGVNCMEEVTSTMLAPERDLQFILTSHHPYIINNIGAEYWKIVTRKGSVVTVRDAKALGIGKSKHQAFLQLINLDSYDI
uniref:Predicted ATPase n=1 Tax=Candidatus Kentrum sp. TUN TaxID=2126343 RepID=A0A450ZVM9_9GAMM|nr:MAG: Predicted ATPase [Candidatus Kentron sp. TUN]VFK57872.1 MAG: Predicted ATPase [Candidatus Kentron sp. TUN]VFK66708.1 MAG: Predicted ATPase [Candidatus Kentron sp. TUN]